MLDNHRGFHNILVLIDPDKPGALDGAFSRNSKTTRPMRPSCPDYGRLGREGRVNLESLYFYNYTIKNHTDFAEVISRGIGIREIVAPFMLLFYGKAIVETGNWLSQSMYFFSKGSITFRFPKTEGAVRDRNIAERKLSRFACPGNYAYQQTYFITQQTTFMEVRTMNIKNQIKAQIMFVGTKRLIKRRLFEQYLEQAYSI